MAGNTTTKNSASGRILKGAVGALLLLALLAPLGSATGFRASSSAASGAATVSTLDLTPPAGTQQYDVMLAGIAIRGACTDVTAPVGWTKLRCDAVTGATTLAQTMYWKAASASESAPYTWTFAAPVAAAGGISSYSGVDSAAPFDVNGTGYNGQANSLAGPTVTAPALTTSQANQRVVGFFGIATQTTLTPTGMSERFDVKSGLATASSGLTLEGTDFTQATAGSTGAKSSAAGVGAVGVWVGQLAALKIPTVSFEDATSSFAESATPAIAVTLSAPSSDDATVEFELASDGTNATTPADYSPSSGSLYFPAGVTSVNLPVTLVDDASDEPDQTVKFELAGPANAVFPDPESPPQHTLTITDNDAAPTVEFSTAASSGSEGTTPASLPVRLSIASGFDVTVTYSTSDATAVSGSDYTAIPASPPSILTFAPGETSKTIDVAITDDSPSTVGADEHSETFLVTLSAPSKATLGTNTTHTRTITDNDPPMVTVSSADDPSATEGGDSGKFKFTRTDGDVSAPLTVAYTVLGTSTASATTDYTALSNSVTIAVGQLSANVTVTPVDDAEDEGAETVIVELVAGGGSYVLGAAGTETATVTINDNDIPTVTVVAFDSNATEPGVPALTVPADPGKFRITRSGPDDLQITVAFGVTPVSDAQNFNALPANVIFPVGNTTQDVTLTPKDDPLLERVVPVVLTLTPGASYAIGTANTATVYLSSNDGSVISMANAPSVNEGNATHPGKATFTVTLNPAPPVPVTVRYRTVDGTGANGALSGSDYIAETGTVAFAANDASETFDVAFVGDILNEVDESFSVELFQPSNATFSSTAVVTSLSATAQITNEDGPPTLEFALPASNGGEGDTPATFTVRMSAVRPYEVDVSYAVTGGSATAGSDFTLAAGTLTFDPGQSTKTISMPILDDAIDEADETVVITLSDFVNATLKVDGNGTHTYNLFDNDQPLLSFRYAASTFHENAGSVLVEVVVSPVPHQSVDVDYTAFDGGASGTTDFTLAPGTLTFAAGDGSENITVALINDNVDEGTENFDIILSNVGAAASFGDNTTSLITLIDADDPGFSVAAPASIPEQGPAASFTVTRVGPTTRPITVAYNVGGTATAGGTDYPTLSGTVDFASGQATALVSVLPTNDAVDEPDETIILTLVDGADYNLTAPTTATAPIADDDDPTVTVAATDASAAEAGLGEGTFTITRSGSLVFGQVVNLAASGTATAGSDYTALPATVTFDAGETTKTVTVTPLDDASDEPAETVVLTLSAGSGYVVGSPASGTVSIADDDLPTVTVAKADDASEAGLETGNFTVTRTLGDLTQALVVDVLVGGNATPGDDYVALASTVTIPTGEASVDVAVTPLQDAADEHAETVILTVLADAAYTVGGASSATVDLADDDGAPTLGFAADSSSAGEASSFDVTVSLSQASQKTVTVAYAVTGGTAYSTASAPSADLRDYTSFAGTLTFAPGVTSQDISGGFIDDTYDEGADTIVFGLSGPANADLAGSVHTLTIDDDDATPSVGFEAPFGILEEDGALPIGVAMSSPSGRTVTVDYAITGGDAINGTDYVLANGTVTVEPGNLGSGVGTILGELIEDALDESDETIVLTLSNPVNATLGDSAQTVTILDDDFPTVTVAATADGEDGSPENGTFTVTRTDGNLSEPLTVLYDVGDGTATAGDDYAALNGSVVIPAGETSAEILVEVVADGLDEDNETVTIQLSGGDAVFGDPQEATLAIADGDDPPVLEFESASSEAVESLAPYGPNVTLSNPSGKVVTVNFTTAGTATGGTDFGSTSGTVTLLPGESVGLLDLGVNLDSLDEDDETIVVTLSDPANATLGALTQHTYTILDDDDGPTVAFYQANASTPEDTAAGNLNLTVALSGPSSRTITVELAVTGGSATPGDDFDLAEGTLTFTPGQTHKSVAVTGLADALDENDETLEATLSSPSNATLGAIVVHTLTITDDDAMPTVSWRTATSGAAENSTTAVWADLSAASGRTVTVGYAVAAGTAGAGDFTAAAGTLTFAAGNTSQSVAIVSAADSLDEADETVTATLSGPSAASLGATTVHTHTIADDDAPPTVAFATAASSGAESSTPANLTVNLSGASGKTVTVAYSAADGTAGSADYTLANGTLAFAPGETSKVVSAAILTDGVDEADETFTVTLASPANATLGGAAVHTRTITDENDAPTLTFEDATSSSVEGAAATVAFNVTSTDSTEQTVTVDYAITGGSAANGTDYVLASGTLTFGPSETVEAITVSILDDIADEPNETFTVTLSDPVNAALGAITAHTHTLVDDDAASSTVSLRASDTSGSETGPATGAFRVTRTGNLGVPITVHYTVGGTATPGADYVALPGSVDLGAGVASATILVTPVNDALNEGSQTVVATVVAAHGYVLGTAKTGTVTILDNDPLPKVSFAAATGSEDEDAGTLTVNVTLSAVSGRAVTVKYTTTALTAKSPADYTASTNAVLTFAAGETSKTVAIPLADDALDEANETFRVALSSPVGASLGTVRTFTGTIVDDDAPPTVGFQLENSTAAETGTRIITVSLSGPSAKTVTVHFATSNVDAVAGSDYNALSGTVSFLPGTLSKTITVGIRADSLPEADEAFLVTLDSPANAVLGTDVHTVTIADND